tara:strand:+ start:31791 stop:32528 length:738 start_codon:yes stop_codon:yes gene_type:complete
VNINQFNAIVDQISNAKTKQELHEISLAFCQLVNMPYYVIGVFSQDSLYSPAIHTLNNYPKDWMDLYAEQNRHKNDPVIAYMLTSHSPVRWDKLLKNERFQSVEQVLFMKQAIKYGLSNGFSIPIKSISSEFAIFSMAIGEAENAIDIMDNAQPFAHTFATHLFERFLAILSQEEIKQFELTKRERECMFWACEGKTTWEISKIIDISERTVLYHLNNSTKKLGAINRQHAVAISINRGLIKPNL